MTKNTLYPTEVLFLGTGTSKGVPEIGCNCEVCCSDNPKDKRLRTSALLFSADQHILVDCGPDFRQQMLTNRITRLDGVIITHEHYDHIGGLDDVRPYGQTDIYAYERVLDVIQKNMPYSFVQDPQHKLHLPDMTLHKVSDKPFIINNWTFEPIGLIHYQLPVLGFRIHNFAYLTDLSYLAESEFVKLQGLDVLVIEALRIEPHPSHISLPEALEVIKRLKPKRTYLTHISHGLGLHDEVQQTLPENVFLAYDGLRIMVNC